MNSLCCWKLRQGIIISAVGNCDPNCALLGDFNGISQEGGRADFESHPLTMNCPWSNDTIYHFLPDPFRWTVPLSREKQNVLTLVYS
jgi:hypothetical protein